MLSLHCHDFYYAHQEQVELMYALRKASLGGKTHMGGGDAPASLLFTLLIRGQLQYPCFSAPPKRPFTPLP